MSARCRVTPGQIVGSKYLLTLGWCSLCFALATAVWVVKAAVLGTLGAELGGPTWRGAFLPCWWCCCTVR